MLKNVFKLLADEDPVDKQSKDVSIFLKRLQSAEEEVIWDRIEDKEVTAHVVAEFE